MFFKKFTITVCMMILLTAVGFAEETEEEKSNEWKLTADFNFNLTQNAYSDNWEGNEKGSISWVSTGNFGAQKQLSPIANWNNTLKLAYGQTHTQAIDDSGDKYWEKPEKSTDKVDLESIMRFTLKKYIDPYVSFRLETQFTDAEDNMFNPKTMSEAAGIARKFIDKEKTELLSRLGFALRQRMVKDMDTTNDGGIEFVTTFSHNFSEGKKFDSNLRVYKALFYSESDDSNDDWKSPDVDWENTLSMSIVKYLSMNMYFQLLYDKEVDSDPRFKETLGLGITYKLF